MGFVTHSFAVIKAGNCANYHRLIFLEKVLVFKQGIDRHDRI